MKVLILLLSPSYLLLFVALFVIFDITEELASLKSMRDRTTELNIFEKVDHCIKNLGLDCVNLTNITTGGTPNMRGKNIGFIGRVLQLCYCIIHQ